MHGRPRTEDEALLDATLVAREDLDERNALFRVRPDAGVPPFQPGQFVELGLPADEGRSATAGALLRRAYSIASAPGEEPLELFLARVDEGRLTTRLWALRAGARLACDARPKGAFTLERVDPARALVFVATGTGLAPFRSMLRARRASLERGERSDFGRVALLHGARAASALAWRAELEELAREQAGFRYLPVLSREPPGAWSGARGRVQALLEPRLFAQLAGFALEPSSCTVLLCGNPEMIADVRHALEARGFTLDTRRRPGSLRLERYW